MKIINKDMLQDLDLYDFVGFTANSSINHRKELVMGAGIAKEFKLMYPELPKALGEKIKPMSVYGLVRHQDFKIFAFQTKTNWSLKSTLELVQNSTNMLNSIALAFDKNTFAINFPAIGLGGLAYDDVFNIIKHLPDNVYVYKLHTNRRYNHE